MLKVTYFWIVCFAAALTLSCSKEEGEPAALGSQCSLHSDCQEGLSCLFGYCRIECRTARDCEDGAECLIGPDEATGACQLPDESSCTKTSDCPGDLVCAFGGCVVACESGDECSDGLDCSQDPKTQEQACISPEDALEDDDVADEPDPSDAGPAGRPEEPEPGPQAEPEPAASPTPETDAASTEPGTEVDPGTDGGADPSDGTDEPEPAPDSGTTSMDPGEPSGPRCESLNDEPNESEATACWVPVGEWLEGRILADTSDQIDCFNFDVRAGVTYSLSIESSTGGRLYYSVVSESGVELATQALLYGVVSHYKEMVAERDEVATLCIEGDAHDTQYEYRYRIDSDWRSDLVQDDVSFEPNNTVSTAYPVELAQWWSSTVTASVDDWLDCYRFDVQAGVTYSLSIESSAGGRLYYFVVTESGVELAPRALLYGVVSHYEEMVAERDEVAVLCVEGDAHDAQYEYRYRIDPDWRSDLVQDDVSYEPNNTVSTAYPVDLAQWWSSTIMASVDDWLDCFRFNVETGVTYSLSIESSTGGRLYYSVVSESGVELATRALLYGVVSHYEEMVAERDEVATLCVEGDAHDAQYEYRYRIDPDWRSDLVQDDVSYEPNNTISTAYPVELAQWWSSTITASVDDWLDCFRFNVEAGGTYSLSIENSTGGRLYYSVVSESGVELATRTLLYGVVSDSREMLAERDEAMMLCIEGDAHDDQYEYTFRIDGT